MSGKDNIITMKKDMNKVTDTQITVVNENSVTVSKMSVAARSSINNADKGRGIKGTKIVATLFVIMITAVLMMLMVSNLVLMNECTVELEGMKNRIEELSEEEHKLTVELEKKNDLLSVEEYAQSNLGMVSEETLDSAYIEGESEDGVEIFNDTDDTQGLFATVMNALGENIISAWNSLQKSE